MIRRSGDFAHSARQGPRRPRKTAMGTKRCHAP
jgi:hypothetical protein